MEAKRQNSASYSDDSLRPYAEAVCADLGHEVIKKIGSGNSSSVYKVTADGQAAALKIYHPRFFEGDAADVEKRRVLEQMSLKGHGNPNLIDFLAAGRVKETYYLLMEFFPWRPLDQCLDALDRFEIAGIISKIADAAEFLECRNFVHRDIKPANILISDDCKEVKLLDLGVIRTISAEIGSDGTDQGYALPFVATAQYSSPAYLFRESPPTENMWKALTFYQLGAVLHDLLMARPLFDHEVRTRNRYRVAAAVLFSTPEVQASDVPPWLVALARNCLVKNDAVRLSRVYWNSFHVERRSNINEMRGRLGLGTFEAPTCSDSNADRNREERLKVRLDRGLESLIEFCRHVLRREGFPQAGMRRISSNLPLCRRITFSFSPTNSVEQTTKLHFVLRLSAQNESCDYADVFLTSYLTKCDGIVPEEHKGNLLWTTRLDDLEAEGDQLISCLLEEFINYYATADDQLRVFEENANTVLEIPARNLQDG